MKDKVVIYGAEWCGPCHATKHYLESIKVSYNYHDVDKDPTAGATAFTKSGARSIPVIDIGGDIIIGFDRAQIDSALKAHHIVA